jgi:hypothetical protein
MTRRNLHGLTALFLIIGALLFALTSTVWPAVLGLVFVAAAAVCLFLARGRD